jgi:Short C-terminal domain
MSAYNASHDATAPTASSTAPARSSAPPATSPTQISPLNLVPGLQAAAAARASHDPIDELTRLGELHKQGVLNDEEFATAKAKLLKQM